MFLFCGKKIAQLFLKFNVKLSEYETSAFNIPMTELFDAKAHIQAHSGGTVKLVRAHCESP